MPKEIIIEGFGGERYAAATPHQVVQQMRATSWGGDLADGVRGYMRQIAKRVKDWCGKSIRTERAEDFLDDLAKAGLIRVVKTDAPHTGA